MKNIQHIIRWFKVIVIFLMTKIRVEAIDSLSVL